MAYCWVFATLLCLGSGEASSGLLCLVKSDWGLGAVRGMCNQTRRCTQIMMRTPYQGSCDYELSQLSPHEVQGPCPGP